MKRYWLFILFASLSGISCSRDGQSTGFPVAETLNVSSPTAEQAKIELGEDMTTYLNTDDVFSVFHRSPANEIWYYDGPDRCPTGQIKHIPEGQRSEIFPHITAISPYNASNSVSYDDGIPYVHTVIPSAQSFNNGNFDSSSAITVACDESEPLHFRYACGFLELDLAGPAEISSVTLRGNDGEGISGKVCFEIDGSSPNVCSVATEKSVIMRGRGAEPFRIPAETKMLFCVVPQTFRKGVTYEITYASGNTQTVSLTTDVVVRRGHIPNPVKAACRDYRQFDICFLSSDGEACCPFKTTVNRNIIPVGVSGTTAESAAVYLLSDADNNYPFHFYVKDIRSSESLRITKAGLNIGGSIGDYIKFPGIEGKRLSRVDVALTGGKNGICFYLCGEDGRRLCDDVSSNKGAAYTVYATESLEGEAVRMVLQRESYCFIHSIHLIYE